VKKRGDSANPHDPYLEEVRAGIARYLRAEDQRDIPLSVWLFLITATGTSIVWIMLGGDHRKAWHFLIWWIGLGVLWTGMTEWISAIAARRRSKEGRSQDAGKTPGT
jgi:hypothetical protein